MSSKTVETILIGAVAAAIGAVFIAPVLQNLKTQVS